jgi:hypothetical protein
MKLVASLRDDDIRFLEVAANKISCARQALKLDTVLPYISSSVAENFFREAIFALADAQYLRDCFWRSVILRYGVSMKDELYVDFDLNCLYMQEK